MTHSKNMYGLNCREYALETMSNKTLAPYTRHRWTKLVDYLSLDSFEYPPNEVKLWEYINNRYPNPRTKRGVLQTLNCLLGTKMKTGKPSSPAFDLPDFDELDAIIQTPKNKYQARCRMYANLMLHAGLRIGETMHKHQIVKNSIIVEYQRVNYDNSLQKAKTTGQVLLPDWLLSEYKDWKVDCPTHRTLRQWFNVYFNSKDKHKAGISIPNLSPHKLRHMYATHYATKLPPAVLQKQLRHSSIETTMSYYVHVPEIAILEVLNGSRKHLRAV